MTHYRRYHFWSTLTVLLALFAESSANMAGARLVIVLPFILCAWWLFRDRVVSPIPRWLINTLLFAATLYVFYSVSRILRIDPQRTVTILADYLVALITIKSFESRTPRDQAQLLILTGMLAIAAVLSNVHLLVAIFLFAYAPALLMAVMHFQFFSVIHRSIGPARKPQPAVLASTPTSGRRRITDFAALTALCSLTIAILGIGVFIIMPRGVGETEFGAAAKAGAGASVGFSDVLQLSGQGIISDSPSIVAEVEIYSREGPITLQTQQYFRGAVLDEYDPRTGRWQRSIGLLDDFDEVRSSLLRNDADRRETLDGSPFGRSTRPILDQRFRLFNMTSSHLFALWRPTNIAYQGTGSVYLSPIDGTLLRPNRTGFVEYWVRSAPSDPGLPDPSADTKDLAQYLAQRDRMLRRLRQTPIHDHALQVLADSEIDFDLDNPPPAELIASTFERYLRENFFYTLELAEAPTDTDPIHWFLTERRAGHCEHFASAMAAMCQALNVPARIVTGFLTSEFDPARGAYIVRQRHAHAWVEVQVTEPEVQILDDATQDIRLVQRWKRFDPTPAASLAALNQRETGLAAWMRTTFDRLEQAWILRVIAYDSSSQRRFLENAGIDSSEAVSWIQRLTQRLHVSSVLRDDRGDALQRFIDRAIVLVLLVVGIASLWYAFRQRRRPPAATAHARSVHSPIPAYNTMQKLLRRAGKRRPRTLPPLAFARRLEAIDPDLSHAAVRITSLHYACRYNAHTPTESQLSAAASDLNLIRARLLPLRKNRS